VPAPAAAPGDSPLGRLVPPVLRRHPAFARQWLGYLAATLGDQVGWIALVWLVIRLTGGAAAVGLVTAAYIGPQVVVAPLAGALLDRYGRARLMAAASAAVGVMFAVLALIGGGLHGAPVGALYPAVVLTGALIPFGTAGRVGLVAEVVPAAELSQANFLLQGGGQLAALVGPALAGGLVAAVGSVPLLWADAAAYAAQAMLLASVVERQTTGTPAPAAGVRATLADLAAGFSFVAARPALVAFAALEVLFNFLYGPFEVLLPNLARTLGGPWTLGLMWTAFGAGALAASAWYAVRPWRLAPSRAFAAIIVLWALVALAMSRIHGLPEACALLLVGGVVYGPWAALYATVLQRVVPGAMQSRVAGSLSALIVGGMPAGALCGGLVLGHMAGATVFALSGAATLALGIAVAALPMLRGLDGTGPPA